MEKTDIPQTIEETTTDGNKISGNAKNDRNGVVPEGVFNRHEKEIAKKEQLFVLNLCKQPKLGKKG